MKPRQLAIQILARHSLKLARPSQAEFEALLQPHKEALADIEDTYTVNADGVYVDAFDEIQSVFASEESHTRKSNAALALLLLALVDVKNIVSKAWKAGLNLGEQHASKELALAEIRATLIANVDGTYIAQILTDIELANTEAYNALITALSNNLQPEELSIEVERIAAQLQRRAGMSISAAINRAYSEQQLAIYAEAMRQDPTLLLKKVWVTDFTPTTCQRCADLDGAVLGIYDSFNQLILQPIYINGLAPPMHPRCRCRLVLRVIKQ